MNKSYWAAGAARLLSTAKELTMVLAAMPDENKLKMGREPVYQPDQPVKTLISPVKLSN